MAANMRPTRSRALRAGLFCAPCFRMPAKASKRKKAASTEKISGTNENLVTCKSLVAVVAGNLVP